MACAASWPCSASSAGLAHAVVVPLTFLSPDTEFTPLFAVAVAVAVAVVLLALWALGTAATGARAEETAPTQELAAVG
ncbi:hypothetical protein SAMN05428965_1816 [Geodermatophilus sp. DSM 45219]|nr:hypothetical protein SAMN05428965_1816 [Geodermatophilus sp. DSM 45219]